VRAKVSTGKVEFLDIIKISMMEEEHSYKKQTIKSNY
jgi:hypothetical protein